MATDRGRGRRAFHFTRGSGSRHQVHNEALYRYTRDELLSMFTDAVPSALTTDFSSEVYLSDPRAALFRPGAPFAQPLGEDVNAERHSKATPEWANPHPPLKASPPPSDPTQPLPPPTEEIYEEKYAEIDRQIELKMKVEEEKEEPIPEWAESQEEPKKELVSESKEVAPPAVVVPPPRPAAKFSSHLLTIQLSKGDPFAKVISDNSTTDAQGFTYVFPHSPPLEKIWFYRDPQNQVQGPFSSAEMYNWNLVGYFPASLMVALQSAEEFVSLKELSVAEVKEEAEEEKTEAPAESPPKSAPEEPATEFSLFSYNSDKSSKQREPAISSVPAKKQTVWGPKEAPVTKSLLEIQREEIETGNRKT